MFSEATSIDKITCRVCRNGAYERTLAKKASKCALNNSGVAVQGIKFEAVQIGKSKNVLPS